MFLWLQYCSSEGHACSIGWALSVSLRGRTRCHRCVASFGAELRAGLWLRHIRAVPLLLFLLLLLLLPGFECAAGGTRDAKVVEAEAAALRPSHSPQVGSEIPRSSPQPCLLPVPAPTPPQHSTSSSGAAAGLHSCLLPLGLLLGAAEHSLTPSSLQGYITTGGIPPSLPAPIQASPQSQGCSRPLVTLVAFHWPFPSCPAPSCAEQRGSIPSLVLLAMLRCNKDHHQHRLPKGPLLSHIPFGAHRDLWVPNSSRSCRQQWS